MKKATVIIPTTGTDTLVKCIESVLTQTYPTLAYIVIDGFQYKEKVSEILYSMDLDEKDWVTLTIPQNIGSGGFYGHRVYAGVSHFVNSDYVLYLDQDCFLDEDHVESAINTIETNNLDWCYSLRKIVDKKGEYVCNDDCESLGKWNPVMQYNHVDTNCYCIKTSIATKICQVWHGKWGQDRVFYSAMSQHFPNFDCSGKYTLNYRIEGNEGSVRPEFFEQWNQRVDELYNGKLPWRK
jgi:glycosyltransferase involved in cell wall biosynthesis